MSGPNELTFEEQLETFLKVNLSSDDEIERFYEPIRQDLSALLRTKFPMGSVRFVGEMTYGLWKQSALELQLFYSPGVRVVDWVRAKARLGTAAISLANLQQVVLNLLLGRPHQFSRVRAESSRFKWKLRFLHRRTRVYCDLRFDDPLRLYAEPLFETYLFSDPKFLPALYLARRIATYDKLSDLLNKYATNVLFIFYLQHLGLVPSVAELKRRYGLLSCPAGGWWVLRKRARGEEEAYRAEPTQLSVPQLVSGFFEYYSKFDFDAKIVSVHDGRLYDKRTELEDMLEAARAECASWDNDRNDQNDQNSEMAWRKPMCVQNPIELNKSLTQELKYDASFVTNLRYVWAEKARSVESHAHNGYVDLLKDALNFDASYYRDKFTPKPESVSLSPPEQMKYYIDGDEWCDDIYSSVQEYLVKVLHLEVELVEDEDEVKRLSRFATEKGIGVKDVKNLRCRGAFQLWRDRKDFEVEGEFVGDELSREIEISRKMLEYFDPESKRKSESKIVDFVCQLYRTDCAVKYAYVRLLNYGCDSEMYRSLFAYARETMRPIIRRRV